MKAYSIVYEPRPELPANPGTPRLRSGLRLAGLKVGTPLPMRMGDSDAEGLARTPGFKVTPYRAPKKAPVQQAETVLAKPAKATKTEKGKKK